MSEQRKPSGKRASSLAGSRSDPWASSEDGAFSNLGVLLSDQCAHAVKVAVFEGASKTVFKDRAGFGLLLTQVNDVYE